MPTENRRVATYLPKELDDRFKAFIAERNLKGDSAALILILSEFLGVAHSVNKVDYSGFATTLQLEELSLQVSEMARIQSSKSESNSELLGRLDERLRQVEEALDRVKVETLVSLQDSELVPTLSPVTVSQMSLLASSDSESSDSASSDLLGGPNSESNGSNDAWMATRECWEYLSRPCAYDTFRRYSSERLQELYGLEINSQATGHGKRWLKPPLSSVKSPNQVSPIAPQGSERSGEG